MSQAILNFPKGYHFIHQHVVGSTMDEAYAIAQRQEINKTFVILADKQIKGRGRKGRVWTSSVGNLSLSLLLKADPNILHMGHYAFITAVSILSTINIYGVVKGFSFKWPNDLMVSGEKLGGVLLEYAQDLNKNDCLIIGIGMNIHNKPDQKTLYATTYLDKHLAAPVNIREFVCHFSQEFSHWMKVYCQEGFKAIKKIWLENTYAEGTLIKMRHERGSQEGYFHGIDTDGSLLLKNHKNNIIKVTTGDVTLVKTIGKGVKSDDTRC